VNSDTARSELIKAGADPRYTVAAATRFGTTSPIVQITGTGATPQAAIGTAKVVGHAVVGELNRMQEEQKVDPGYRITTLQIEFPDGPHLQASGQLRMLVAVLVLGTIVLFIVVSITDAFESLRRERAEARGERAWTDEEALIYLDEHMENRARSNGHAVTDDVSSRAEAAWLPPGG
jgi:hypothetical protein